MYRTWWVYATARETNHKLKVGPFLHAVDAGDWVDEHRPTDKWKGVKITSTVDNKVNIVLDFLEF